MDRLWVRTAARLVYRDPAPYLVQLRRLEVEVAASSLPEPVRQLRTNELKEHRELREAALFCHGMSSRLGLKVALAKGESRDYDFVARLQDEGCSLYLPVQLKEVVPRELNPEASLPAVLSGLTKYTDSQDLTVAIHLNQRLRFDPLDVSVPHVKLSGVWIFGALSENQTEWGLWGDFLARVTGTTFRYPAA